ncbi:MAG: phage holin family protein [Thiomicrorhabdus sp.]|nr:phage holin family protein [Thiomicrorhabdus sp.]
MEKGFELSGGIFTAIALSFIGSWQWMVVIFGLYMVTMITNLVTGIMCAKQQKIYDQEIARKATYKKLVMIIAIIMLLIFDVIVMGLIKQTHISILSWYTIPWLSTIMMVYQIFHEVASVSENVKKAGNKVPKSLDDAIDKGEEVIDNIKLGK